MPLGREFYARPVLAVARELVGKILVHRSARGEARGRIVEVEAYRGPEDRAAHSFCGRRTRRTEVMYGAAGHAYVFLLYGLHWNFNVVTAGIGQPEAVLIRAVQPVSGIELMAARRGLPADAVDLTNGPGKVCQAFGIDKQHYGADLTASELHIEDAPRIRTARSERIGVEYAGDWARRPWRFFDPKSRFVSQRRRAI
jgi:DNA-3-methyladenine glycosylase